MASRQGLKTNRKEQGRRHKPRPSRDALNRLTWIRFLYTYTHAETGEATRFNGKPMKDSHKRAVYRWIHEGSSPSVWTADSFLVYYEMILEDYFVWCEDFGLEAWANGAPDWWDAID